MAEETVEEAKIHKKSKIKDFPELNDFFSSLFFNTFEITSEEKKEEEVVTNPGTGNKIQDE